MFGVFGVSVRNRPWSGSFSVVKLLCGKSSEREKLLLFFFSWVFVVCCFSSHGYITRSSIHLLLLRLSALLRMDGADSGNGGVVAPQAPRHDGPPSTNDQVHVRERTRAKTDMLWNWNDVHKKRLKEGPEWRGVWTFPTSGGYAFWYSSSAGKFACCADGLRSRSSFVTPIVNPRVVYAHSIGTISEFLSFDFQFCFVPPPQVNPCGHVWRSVLNVELTSWLCYSVKLISVDFSTNDAITGRSTFFLFLQLLSLLVVCAKRTGRSTKRKWEFFFLFFPFFQFNSAFPF